MVMRATVLDGYARGDAAPLRDVLRALGDAVKSIEVDVPAVLGDLDTPDDLRALGEGRLALTHQGHTAHDVTRLAEKSRRAR